MSSSTAAKRTLFVCNQILVNVPTNSSCFSYWVCVPYSLSSRIASVWPRRPLSVPAPKLKKGSLKAHANSKTWHRMSLGFSLFLERKSFDLYCWENNSTRKGRSFQEVQARVSFFLSLQALRHLFVGPLSYSWWHGLWLWCALPLLHTSSQR